MDSVCLNNYVFRISYMQGIVGKETINKTLVSSGTVLTIQREHLQVIKIQKTCWGLTVLEDGWFKL